MPELGKYALEVLSSYGISLALLAGVSLLSYIRARKVRSQLATLEQRRHDNG